MAAKSLVELSNKLRSEDVRMGKPTDKECRYIQVKEVVCIGELREVKHLSTSRKRNQLRDSPSSGERTGKSPNISSVRLQPLLEVGLGYHDCHCNDRR